MAKKQIKNYAFNPGVAGQGTLKFVGRYSEEQLLLITNVTAGEVLASFADASKPTSLSYILVNPLSTDVDFPSAHNEADYLTVITFLYDTSTFTSTDSVQIFVEVDEQTIRPWDFGTDAIERMRIAEPQSMLDADFEYGIQPTKWQSLDLFRNYPSLYEIPGTSIGCASITTDASSGTSFIGPSSITVQSVLDHGLIEGDPISIRGIDDSVFGYSKAEGSFVVAAVVNSTEFTFFAKGKVGTLQGTQLLTNFTEVKKAGFYTGAAIGTPTLSVLTQGATGNVLSDQTSPASGSIIGLTASSVVPPIGAPILGVAISSGSQITSTVASSFDKEVTTSFVAPVSSIVLNDVTNIEVGHAVSDGSGANVFVTNITNNEVFFDGDLTTDKNGNNLSQNFESVSPVNFGQGSGGKFDITRTAGVYAAVITPTSFFPGRAQDSYSGTFGNNAQFSVTANHSTGAYSDVQLLNGGVAYSATETITISGVNLGGATTANDLVITIDTVDATGAILTFTPSPTAVATSTNPNVGENYTTGETLIIYGTQLDGESPANDLKIILTGAVGGSGEITTFTTTGTGVSPDQDYNGISGSGGTGSNATFNIQKLGGGLDISQLEEITIGGIIEADDVFSITIDGTPLSYTALAGETITAIRNELIDAVNTASIAGTIDVWASAGDTSEVLYIEGLTAGTAFTIAVATNDTGGAAADTQTFTVSQIRAASSTSGSPAYSVVVANPGSGFTVGDNITILGNELGGVSPENDLIVNVASLDPNNGILTFNESGVASSGDASYLGLTGQAAATGATIKATINASGNYVPVIGSPGANYEIGYELLIDGSTLGAVSPDNDMTVTVVSVDSTGSITEASATGLPASGDTITFRPSMTISEPLFQTVPTGTSYSYSSIAKIQATFTSNHGLLPGSQILVAITSNGVNHGLCSGPFFIESVPTPTSLVYTSRSTGNVNTGTILTGSITARSDTFYVHRPFDGGVQIGTGSPAHGAQAIRQSKKYIRYQSGKGIMYTTGVNFAPSYDIRSVIAEDITPGSKIEVITDDIDHGLQVGAEITLEGITSTGYNGHYTVTDIVNENTFKVEAQETLEEYIAKFGIQPQVGLYAWKGATVRSGCFDEQNGIFFQYDGTNYAIGLRSSTFQLAGTLSVDSGSNEISGSNTRFREQLKTGDRIVLRGMTHVVTNITDNTTMYVNPDYRGVSDCVNSKAAITRELIIPQSQWNIDKCDGTGQSGYKINVNKMQMIGFQYSWYGAGFIDWMLRGPRGDYIFLHRLKNNNLNTEAYMRSGNLPVRYEVINEGPGARLVSNINSTDTSITLDDATLFPDFGTLYIDNELIRYNSKNGNTLSGLTRSATFSNFVAGSQRSYTAGVAADHDESTGVVLASVTATPQINHWGSAFLTDGKFDEDRGYIFSYRLPTVQVSVIKSTLFLIRLSPSVSNAIIGDLGERELINRAQLLLKNIDIVVEGGQNTQTVIVEGVLNPSNYPVTPSDVSWSGLNNQGAGGQPSFAQVATSVDWGTVATSIAATNAIDNGTRNYHYFTPSDVSGVNIGDNVSTSGASGKNFTGGETITDIGNSQRFPGLVYIEFSSKIDAGAVGQTTFTFTSLAGSTAQPGEQAFSFTAGCGSGDRDGIDLSGLKELTNTPIGGTGAFPNGPDVLAVNAFLSNGSDVDVTINLRWSEAQA
ncbi:hypothetical protein S250808_112 [Synechococcus phage S-CAM3]|uniref:Virion structural protein n=1 Tax=Synechococcus phage S-CAM3 TaxID=1883366 RepID=A0A1D8KJ00_9CAUD|nr:hypothetical protein S250808_112 [Synechococcus phage S-CAM3]